MPSNNTKPCSLQANFEEFHKRLIRSYKDDPTGESDKTLTELTDSESSMASSSISRSSQMNAVSFQSNPGLPNVAQGGPARSGNFQYISALQLPPPCLNVVNRGKTDRPQLRKPTKLSFFKSILTDPKPKKRTYSEINQSLSSFRPICLQISDSTNAKRQRFLRTAEALEKSGLMEVTMESASLLQQNKHLQKEIEDLKKETQKFMQWVMSNPENKHLLSTC